MKTHLNLYQQISSFDNLILAYKKARKGKTKKDYVQKFEQNLKANLLQLENELDSKTYKPKPLKTFVIRDPKTRKISKSDFRDRVIHHALCNVIEPIFDKTFIFDSYANRKGKGNLKAVKRFHKFISKVSRNGTVVGKFNNNQVRGYCLKADIKRYFWEVDHDVLLKIVQNRIKDEDTLWLIEKIVRNSDFGGGANRKLVCLWAT